MLRWGGLPISLAAALVCAHCAIPVSRLPQLPQDEVEREKRFEQIAQMKLYYGELHRVASVGYRIRVANRADCHERVAAEIGLFAGTPESLPKKYRSYANEALGQSWARPTVISVVENSPAAQAGIVQGDELTALNGELIPTTGTARWMTKWFAKNGVKPVEANVRRNGEDRTVTITPVIACSIPVQYVVQDEVNAFTDDKRIVIQSGLVEICKTEAQLASIIGHELAHANLGHMHKRLANAVIGFAAGAAIDGSFALGGVWTHGAFRHEFTKAGALAYSVNFEREADYVGAYYATRAGYDMAGVEEVWRTMSLKHPDSIRFARTHPTSAARFIQMQKVTAEIAGKKARGEPLVPDLRFVAAEQPPMQSGEAMH